MSTTTSKIKWNVASSDRPLPKLDEADTGVFWTAVQEHRLTYPVCRNCATIVFFPRSHCTNCLSEDLEVRESAGIGTVYSFTVVRHNPHPAFAALIPYVVALVDLAEGFRMWTHLRVAPEEVQVGQDVRLDWESVNGFELPVFVAR